MFFKCLRISHTRNPFRMAILNVLCFVLCTKYLSAQYLKALLKGPLNSQEISKRKAAASNAKQCPVSGQAVPR